MAYPIERRIVSAVPKIKLQSNSIIVAHESGNANNTGNNSLEAEVNYMANNWKNAFTHFFVGSKAIIQLAEDGFMAYGAGGHLNPHSPAQVELSRVDTQAEFDESYKRYVWLLRYMADKYSIPKTLDSNKRTGIKTHDWVTRHLGGTSHTDPYTYLAQWGISRAQFKKDVENGISTAPTEDKPVNKPSANKPTAPKTTGIVDYMNSVGMDSSFTNRAKLAKQYGINNYSGTAGQNIALLEKIRDGKLVTKPKPPSSTKVLKYGDSGAEVKAMQQALASVYFYPEKGAKNNGVDGYFGVKTLDALKRFQSIYTPSDIDGIYGPKTRAALERLKK
ncbi:peptidoglycan-binding protein [Filibacter tadaridae]|uniref:Autolysin n=1 Tax=Filibacter tadaridae TaxID=2483811 RepID=A0A3P5X125_9BACL|nr:peptidoglycan-binding protein [Filibacter tadaridae]VDC25000.1 Autolysin [Filibacter tadaridae]